MSLEVLTQSREAIGIETPDMTTMLSKKMRNLASEINCIQVGTIVNFYPENQTADIMVNFKRIFSQQSATVAAGTGIFSRVGEVVGELLGFQKRMVDVAVDYPLLLKCPVVFLTGGVSNMTFPVAPGDTCIVMFNDRDLDAWFEGGIVAPPNSSRMHDLSDGMALVGVRALNNIIADFNEDGPQIINDDALIAVEDKLKLQVGAQTLRNALDDLFTALTGAVISGGSFDATTITNINNAKTKVQAVLK